MDRMESTPRVMRCWPGLPQLWLQGSWAGLALAIGFAVLANVVVLTSFVWTEWLGTNVLIGGWAVLISIWGASWVITERWANLRAAAAPGLTQRHDHLYLEAQEEYLQGNWREAEQALNRLLAESVKDIDARMMLATLKRHTGRLAEAREELDALQRLEASAKWRQEIQSEHESLDRLQKNNESRSEDEKERHNEVGPSPEYRTEVKPLISEAA